MVNIKWQFIFWQKVTIYSWNYMRLQIVKLQPSPAPTWHKLTSRYSCRLSFLHLKCSVASPEQCPMCLAITGPAFSSQWKRTILTEWDLFWPITEQWSIVWTRRGGQHCTMLHGGGIMRYVQCCWNIMRIYLQLHQPMTALLFIWLRIVDMLE